MTSARQFMSSKRWFNDLRKVLQNLEDVDALCNASLDDTGGEWLREMMLCRLEPRAAVAQPRQILEALGMIHALRERDPEQEFDELH